MSVQCFHLSEYYISRASVVVPVVVVDVIVVFPDFAHLGSSGLQCTDLPRLMAHCFKKAIWT